MAVCGCNYGYEGGDYSCVKWEESRINSTRKEHECCECGDIIPVGSRCCSAFEISKEVGAARYYRCLTCAALAEVLASENQACPMWHGLREELDYSETGIDWYEWREKAQGVSQ